MIAVLRDEFSMIGYRHKRIAQPKGALQGLKTVHIGKIMLDFFLSGNELLCRVYLCSTGEHGWYSLTPESKEDQV